MEKRSSLPAPLRTAAALEGAYFKARYRGEAARARALLEEAKKSGSSPTIERQSWLRAEAAVLLGEGSFREARELAEEGIEAAKASMAPGFGEAEAEWLRETADLAQSRQEEIY